MGSLCLVRLGWARCGREGLTAMVPPPFPGVIYHFRLLTWGPGASLLGWAAARGSSGAPWGRAASGEGRSGPAPPEAEAGARPAAVAVMGGRKLPEQIRAEVGPAARLCGTLPPPSPPPHPLLPTPRATVGPAAPSLQPGARHPGR